MSKLTVGQTVLVEYNGFDRRGSPMETLAKVASVGRKYFTIEGFDRKRFFVDTLKHDGMGYSPEYTVWLSQDEYTRRLLYKFSREVVWSQSMGLDDLQTIDAILTKYHTDVK